VGLAPFKDHFTGTQDADGDGVDDLELPLEISHFWPLLIEERELTCPELGTLTVYGTTAATLSTVKEGLTAGTLTISSHGMLTRLQPGGGIGAPRGLVATRQPIGARSLTAEDRASLRSKALLNVRAHGEWVLAWTGAWVRELHGPDNPMPGTVVGLTACNSGATSQPLLSLQGAGASLAYGFDGKVSAAGGLHTDVAIARRYLERDELNAHLDTVGRSFPGDGSTLVWAADPDVYLGESEILKNGSFEEPGGDDPLHWTSVNIYGTDFDAFRVEEYVTTQPTEGDWLAYLFTYDGDPSYAELGQDICPVGGSRVLLTFDWMVRTNEDSSCSSTAVPNWMNVRIQPHPDDPTVLWHVGWADVCPLLTDSGDSFQTTTGWQFAQVEFEAPVAPDPANQRLVFTVGGYNTAGWVGLIDDVTIEYLD
jgi:hypothetical protein